VTIDEAIDIAKKYGQDESYRFVNGILDGVRKGVKRSE
jgi:N utilization substance protein B